MPKKVQKPFFCLFCILAHSVYSTTKVLPSSLERNPVCWSIFIRESHWHLSTSWRNKIILSAVYRVSSPATLPVLLDCDARESTSAERGGCRVNHGVMKQIYSGPSEIQFFTLSLFSVWSWYCECYGLSSDNSRHSFVTPVSFFIWSVLLSPSFIAALVLSLN